jgi:hypothetical protein
MNGFLETIIISFFFLSNCYGSIVVSPLDSALTTGRYRGHVIQLDDTNETIHRHYMKILRDYKDTAFSSREWEVLKKTKDGIEIAISFSGNDPDCPYIRMRAVMPSSAQSLFNFMGFSNWKTFMPIINPFYEGMAVMNEMTVDNKRLVVARKHSTSIFGFGKRDFSILADASGSPMMDGDVLVSGTISVISPHQIPRYRGFTRAYQDLVCFYRPLKRTQEGKDQTELTIMLRTDLNDSAEGGTGGSIPMWLVVKTFGLAGSKAMHVLRNVVRKQVNGL